MLLALVLVLATAACVVVRVSVQHGSDPIPALVEQAGGREAQRTAPIRQRAAAVRCAPRGPGAPDVLREIVETPQAALFVATEHLYLRLCALRL
jgi:hypothetical protein